MNHRIDASYFLKLKEVSSMYAEIPESEWERVYPLLRAKTFAKNEFFIQVDEVPETIAFIISGIFRVFYTSSKGVEKTLVFRDQKHFLSAYSSFLEKQKSPYSIQAITESVLIYMPLSKYSELVTGHNCWTNISGRYAQQLFIEKENRERELLLLNASKRYENFRKKYMHIINEIPNYMIASYLGITPESLSRILR